MVGNDDGRMRKFHAAVGDEVDKEPATGQIWSTNETGASHPVKSRSVFVIQRMCRELEFED